MNPDSRKFPDGFLWGAATASYQVEGGIENNDWAQAAREGKVPPCGRACDHYNRFEADFDLAKELGHNAHRLSIEWARIEPEEGKFDEREIEHYAQVLQALRARGIVPFVTLWHFTQPLWFAHRGGFLHSKSTEVFARYCRFVAERLGHEGIFYMTINEPQIMFLDGQVKGKFPPFNRSLFSGLRAMRGMARAHKAAYAAIHAVHPDAQVGLATHNNYFDFGRNFLAAPLAWFLSWWWNRRFLNVVRGAYDFIGLNHYFHTTIGWHPGSVPRSDMGWEIHPESLYRCLMELRRYKVPVYITENGLADADDSRRAEYIAGYTEKVLNAIKDGADVRGYLHWSLMDNYEWAEGFTKRFGLIEINYETLARTVRPSARLFAKIASENTLPPPREAVQ